MPYPEYLIAPMRSELTDLGARECRTVADVDETLKSPGVVMMVVNSVCGCAAGKARPGIAHGAAAREPARRRRDGVRRRRHRRDRSRARATSPASRPRRPRSGCCATASCSTWSSAATSRSGPAQAIADLLTMAFDKFCTPQTADRDSALSIGVARVACRAAPRPCVTSATARARLRRSKACELRGSGPPWVEALRARPDDAPGAV